MPLGRKFVKKLAEEGTVNANRGAVLAVALTPRRLVACLQRNLDVRAPMPRERMSSFGETTAALEGQRGHIPVANHHEEGLLPRTAATAGHPLLDPTTSTTAASACIASPSCVAVATSTSFSHYSLQNIHPLLASPTPSPAPRITNSLTRFFHHRLPQFHPHQASPTSCILSICIGSIATGLPASLPAIFERPSLRFS